jgi:nicotinamidase-related amidase
MKIKTALIVIDYINDIVDKDGKIPSCAEYVEKYNTIKNVNKAIAGARQKNYPVIHVKVGFSENYNEVFDASPIFGGAKNKNALKLKTWGTEFHKSINIIDNDYIVTKHRISAFYGTELELFLKANRIEKLLICGVSTNMAVELTAREAHDRDYLVEIIDDACGAYNKEMHNISIQTLSIFSKVIKSNHV